MSRVARQLCDEIEAPLKGKDSQRYRNTSKYDDKPKRSIVIDKQRIINKVVPHDRSASRIKFKSEERVYNKSFIDIAVNTILRGPFVNDSNCVTLLRNSANDKCSCKSPQKCFIFKRNAKEVQTFDPRLYAFSDKACLQCIETISCGTQFFNFPTKPRELSSTASQGVPQVRDSKQVDKFQRDYQTQIGIIQRDSLRQANMRESVLKLLEMKKQGLKQTDMDDRNSRQSEQVENSTRASLVNYMGARRWSLSKYPRGPDF